MALEVELKVFDGPLDLLLSLIEKNKINIFDIPIVEITEQYLTYVRSMDEEDLGTMSEFMVMAAELISIKCKMLLPKEEEEHEEEDPRDELVRRLIEYKMYKNLSYELREKMQEAARRVFKKDTTPEEVLSYKPKIDPAEVIGGLTLQKLQEVFESVLLRQEERIDPIRSKFGNIEKEEVSLPDKLISVADFAKKHKTFSFRELLKDQTGKVQVIVTFCAILELIKYGVVKAVQEEPGGEINIEAVPGADARTILELQEIEL